MEKMNLLRGNGRPGIYEITLDINQPGEQHQEGIYRSGPVIGRALKRPWTGELPDGTLLYGQLWTEGLIKYGEEAVYGRYTEALLPDGTRIPVCISLGDITGLTIKNPGSTPGQARLPRTWEARAVRFWP